MLTVLRLLLQTRAALIAENLFLRKQLAMFQERNTRPRRAKPAERLALLALAPFFNWREVLVIVKVETFIGWQRTAFRAFWRWRSRRTGRPPLPKNLLELVREMAAANPAWGQERIAGELSLKLGIRVSPRTVGKYLDNLRPRGGRATNQRWATFVRKHAKGTLANQPQSIPKDIDGQNLLPVLNGQQQPHEAMYWSFNKQRAIRVGEWKLILNYPDIPVWLSNLEADPGEKTNLADAQSDRVRQLTEMIRAWERTVGLPGE